MIPVRDPRVGRIRSQRCLAAAMLLVLTACDELPMLSGPAVRTPARLVIDLDGRDLFTGDTVPIGWTVFDQFGERYDPLPAWAAPQWSSSDDVLALTHGRIAVIASGATTFSLTFAGLSASTSLRVNPASLRVTIPAAYISQGIQRLDGSVPLVAGRNGHLRIFVTGDAPNFFAPTVRAHFYRHGARVATFTTRAADEGVPVSVIEGGMAYSWNVPVPGSLIMPGAALLVEVDSDGGLRAGPQSVMTFPADGVPAPLDARVVAPFRTTFVPIHIIGLGTGDVTPQNVDGYMAATRAVWPLHETDVIVRAPYSTTTRSLTGDDWSALLREIRTLRIIEGSSRYYHGILRREGAWSGLAYLNYPAAITREGSSTWTVAHEFGHNFGRRHAPCGNPAGVDQNYPHAGGGIGVYGLAADGVTTHPPGRADLMTYCSPRWVSDYNYLAVFAFRANEAAAAGASAARQTPLPPAHAPVLVVSGAIGADALVLDPAFTMTTAPALPREAGPHRLQGLDRDGAVLFTLDFTGEALGEGPDDVRHFAFAVPLDDAAAARLARLRLAGRGRSIERASTTADLPGVAHALPRTALHAAVATAEVTARADANGNVTLHWDADRFPLLIVRDPVTGSVLARVRNGTATIPATARELDVHMSDGVASAVQRVLVAPR